VLWRRRRRSRFAEVVRSSVVLHLDTQETIAGYLLAEYDDVLALAHARILTEARGAAIPLDGEVVVPLARIKHAQIDAKIEDTRRLAAAPAEGSRGAA
jgi:hypothetical protein